MHRQRPLLDTEGRARSSRLRVRLLALAAACTACIALLPATAAHAHGEETPTIETFVDAVSPAPEGVDFRIVPGPSARLAASNETDSDMLILGYDGKPFLRLGPRGAYANLDSPDWYASGNPDGIGEGPPSARYGAAPRWQRVSREPEWVWYEHRMHPQTVKVPAEAIQAQRVARLDDWKVPVRLGDESLSVTGHVEYRPLLGNIVPALSRRGQAPFPGVQLQLLPGRLPGLLLVNPTPRTVTVLGREGEPFLRLGPRGASVNLRSPTHVQDAAAKGGKIPDLEGSSGAQAPRWRRVSDGSSYAWLDGRAVYESQRPPRSISEGRERTVLRRWSIPLESGGRRVQVAGTTSWVPTPASRLDPSATGGGGLGWVWLAAGLPLAGIALGGAFVLRRRRSERDRVAVG